MDSRDIKVEVPHTLTPLKDIFNLQKGLIEEYIKIEKMKKYPLNVNLKDNQTLLKDFTSRVIEELAEGYESLGKVAGLTEKNQLWFQDYSSKEYQEMLGHLQNVSEEFADALHFFVELLVYINIDEEDIRGYIDKYVFKNMSEDTLEGKSILSWCMIAGDSLLYADGVIDYDTKINPMDLLRNLDSNEGDRKLLQMGRFYHKVVFTEQLPKILWDVTYHLNLSRNFLRNKPWKQSQVFVNEQGYQEEVISSFLRFMGVFSFFNISDSEVFYLYFKKNQVNQFRIRSKY